MANNYSAQGSITIKRLRNGDSIFLTFKNNGIPLFQWVDDKTGAVTPDWSNPNGQPVITPQASSVRNNFVTLGNHSWFYNQSMVPLSFTGATSGDWTEDSTGKFAINPDGALKIINNLASQQNTANDTLTYKATATVAGVEYQVEKSIDILIQPLGSSSYVGFIIASTEQLTSDDATAQLTTKLQLSSDEITDYHVKWYKDDTAWTVKDGQKVITVGRGDVDGTQLFIAEFYKNCTDTDYVYRAGVRIIDVLDDFQIVLSITSQNKEVSPDNSVTVKAKIINQRTNAQVSPANPTWRMDVMKKSNWTSIKSVNTDTITVSTQETDDIDGENDVEVAAECDWSD